MSDASGNIYGRWPSRPRSRFAAAASQRKKENLPPPSSISGSEVTSSLKLARASSGKPAATRSSRARASRAARRAVALAAWARSRVAKINHADICSGPTAEVRDHLSVDETLTARAERTRRPQSFSDKNPVAVVVSSLAASRSWRARFRARLFSSSISPPPHQWREVSECIRERSRLRTVFAWRSHAYGGGQAAARKIPANQAL